MLLNKASRGGQPSKFVYINVNLLPNNFLNDFTAALVGNAILSFANHPKFSRIGAIIAYMDDSEKFRVIISILHGLETPEG